VGQCQAIKANGQRCASVITGANGMCYAHSPRFAAQRKQRGKGGPNDFAEIHRRIDDLFAGVLSERLPSSVGAVCNQLLLTKLKAIDQQRKTEEVEEMRRRIEDLERERFGRPRPWVT
jgi:hypothetical protein